MLVDTEERHRLTVICIAMYTPNVPMDLALSQQIVLLTFMQHVRISYEVCDEPVLQGIRHCLEQDIHYITWDCLTNTVECSKTSSSIHE